MKNQNDLIFSIVFGVLGLIAFGIAIATKPEPPAIAAPPTITVSDAQLPAASVSYGTALPGGSTSGGMGGARGPAGGPFGTGGKRPGGGAAAMSGGGGGR